MSVKKLLIITGLLCIGFLFVSNACAQETTPAEECEILLEIPESTLYFSNANAESSFNFAILQDNKIQFKLLLINSKTLFSDEENFAIGILPTTRILLNKTDFRYFIKRE